jgi:pyruvate formate lyase activating enzyme
MGTESKELTGKFYDLQSFSVHDGPGIRLTCFMKGCPLRCLWCHSPESQEFGTELNWMEIKCTGVAACGLCIDACPQGAIAPGEVKDSAQGGGEITLVTVDPDKCTDCGACADACPSKALYMCGTDYTVDELMKVIRRDVPFYNKSGGGVTISGGECLCQPAYLLEVLKACKAEGIHTAVDTTGFVGYDVIRPVIPYADLFLYDLKHIDSRMHKLGTGAPNELILENARRIAADGGKFMIRIPVIPLYNDNMQTIERLGAFICELGDAVELVQLLPYHKLGTAKWKRLKRVAQILEAEPPKDELMQSFRERLENMGLKTIIH